MGMRIVHRISFSETDASKRIVEAEGLKLWRGQDFLSHLASFDIDESDQRWPSISKHIPQLDAVDIVWTEFTRRELQRARWLSMSPGWLHDYPQPDGDLGYLKATYDLSEYCSRCGIGARQVLPFRFRREPKWGTRQILGVNWVPDELFVRPEAWEAVLKPFKIQCAPVLQHRSGEELGTVVQLKCDRISDFELDMKGHESEVCESCGRRKHLPWVRGPISSAVSFPNCDIFKTKDCFGSGASAYRHIIISQALYGAVVGHKLRGAVFGVVEEPSDGA